MSAPVTSPRARLTALVLRRKGATLTVSRKLLADLLTAAPDATLAAEHAALCRAVDDRGAALASVTPARLAAHLTATGWSLVRGDDAFQTWQRGAAVVEVPQRVAADYAVRLWEVAWAVAAVEQRHPTRVLAGWLCAP